MVSALTGMASCFMPWANQLLFGQPGKIAGFYFAEGMVCLIYYALVITISLLNGKDGWSRKMAPILAVSSLLPAALAVYKITALKNRASALKAFDIDLTYYVIYDPAIGLYISLASIFSITILSLVTIFWSRRRSLAQPMKMKTSHSLHFPIASSQ